MPCNLVEMICLHYYQISQMLIWVLTLTNLVTNSQDLIHVHRALKLLRTVCDIQNIKVQYAL